MFTPLCLPRCKSIPSSRFGTTKVAFASTHDTPRTQTSGLQGGGLALLSGSREGSSLPSTSAHYLQMKLWKGKRAEIHFGSNFVHKRFGFDFEASLGNFANVSQKRKCLYQGNAMSLKLTLAPFGSSQGQGSPCTEKNMQFSRNDKSSDAGFIDEHQKRLLE